MTPFPATAGKLALFVPCRKGAHRQENRNGSPADIHRALPGCVRRCCRGRRGGRGRVGLRWSSDLAGPEWPSLPPVPDSTAHGWAPSSSECAGFRRTARSPSAPFRRQSRRSFARQPGGSCACRSCPRVPARYSGRKALTSEAVRSASVSWATVCLRRWATNLRNRRQVSRYERTVWAEAFRC